MKVKTAKAFACQECGKLLTLAQANAAANGSKGCPGCGGSDVDLAPSVKVVRLVSCANPTFYFS